MWYMTHHRTDTTIMPQRASLRVIFSGLSSAATCGTPITYEADPADPGKSPILRLSLLFLLYPSDN